MADTSEEKVVLSAIDQFTAVFKQAKQSVEQLKSALDGARDTLAGIGVTVGGGALVKLHLDALAATAALHEMSQQAGASVEGLSAIQNVAKVGGQDFNGFVDQLGRMVKGLKQQGEEGTKAGAAFAYLGIQTKDANGRFRDTAEIVVELAKKLSAYEDGGNKVALVQDALGKGAERYIPLLADIAKNTDLVAKATGAQAEQADQAEKNMRRLQLTMEDSRRELVNSLTPALVDFTNQLLGAVKATGGFWSGVGGWSSVTGQQTTDPITAIAQLDAKLKSLEETKAALSKDSPGAFLNRVFSPEDLAVVNQQIAYAEKQRAILQQILVQRVKGNTAGMVEDAAGNIVPSPAAARLDYQSPDTKRGRQPRMTPYSSAVLEMQQREALEASGPSEFMKTSLAIKAGKYDSIDQVTGQVVHLTEAEKNYLLQLAAAADTERQYKELREDKIKADLQIAKDNDEDAARKRAQVEQFRLSTMSMEQIENEDYSRRKESLANFSDQQLALAGGRQAVEQQMEAEHMDRLRAIRAQGLNTIAAFSKASWEQQTVTMVGMLENMTSSAAQHNRQLFEINKLAAVANATIKGFEAVQSSYAFGATWGGPIGGAAMAAIAAAATFAQVSAILHTQFQGGGNGIAPSVSGSTPAPAVSPVGGTAPSGAQASPQTTIVQFRGSQSESDLLRRFIEALNENSRDGGKILIAS